MSTSSDFDFPMSDNWCAYYDKDQSEQPPLAADIVGLDNLVIAPEILISNGMGQYEQRYYVHHGIGEYNRETALRTAKRCLDYLCEYKGWDLLGWQAFRKKDENSDFFWFRFTVSEWGYHGR